MIHTYEYALSWSGARVLYLKIRKIVAIYKPSPDPNTPCPEADIQEKGVGTRVSQEPTP